MSKRLPDNIVIRPMQADDIDAVYDLDQRSFSTPWPKRSFFFELNENKAARLWVAEATHTDGKEIVGSIICWLLVDLIHVATIAVDAKHQRKYIAQSLLCTALSAMMEEGAIAATLDVREGNLSAQAMYHKLGFEVVGRRPGYYKNNAEAALLMTLEPLNEAQLLKIQCL